MSIIISETTTKQYLELLNPYHRALPLWLSPNFIDCYTEKLMLTAMTGNELRGVWVVPITNQEKVKIAKREYRFLPYASPIIFENCNLKKREIAGKFFDYLITKVQSVYLPMSPDFSDMPIFQSRGALIEWRHTHRLTKPLELSKVESRLRNHIKYAEKNVEIILNDDINNFKFEIAIKSGQKELLERKTLAQNILFKKQAIVISAKHQGNFCGGVLLVFDNQTAYLLHSWQLKQSPRGTISKLINEAINWTFNIKNLKYFDFEGSVINNIDYFFCGFNAQVTPYGFIHWSSTRKGLIDLVNRSIEIDGRVAYDNSKTK